MNALKTQLINLLLGLPTIDHAKNRPAYIEDLVSPHLRQQIDWQGSTRVFVTGLVELLGKQRQELLSFLDELAKSDRFGIDRLPLIHQLRGEIAILSPQEWYGVFGPSDWTEWGALPDCPYRGLLAFQREHKDLFFGREKFVDRLLKKVDAEQLVAVIGSSGSGKSSVVFAGLMPQLPENWEVISFRPGKEPFESLAAALLGRSANAGEVRELAGRLREGKVTLGAISSTPQTETTLLVADQFEELYTLCSEWETREGFLDCLLEAADNAPGFKLVLTMRADFYDYALRYRPFADALESAYAGLGPMNQEELREAISVPAESRGVSLEEGLLKRILEDIDKKPDEEENNSNGKQPPDKLPLLEFALKQLWEAADESNYPELTHKAYDDIGGVKLALGKYAEKVYGELQQENRDAKQIKQVFIQLVQPGEETGTGDTRRLATREEIGTENWDLALRLNQEEVRLVVVGRDEVTETETVEVVHEVLISGWSRLTGWMNGNREFRVWQERLRAELREWKEKEKDKGALLRGRRLAEAEGWLLERGEEISLPERGFIRESVGLRDREKWILRLSLGVVSFVATVASSIAAYPFCLQWKARKLGEMQRISSGNVTFITNSSFKVESFYIDKYEVSNRQYVLCVQAGKCGKPADPTKLNRHIRKRLLFLEKHSNENFLEHPVVNVTAYQAADYCQWLGRRLPTELEWEHAAGGGKNLPQPWGEEPISLEYANVSGQGFQSVRNCYKGQSVQGVCNLIGNAWEWTASYWPNNFQDYNSKLVWFDNAKEPVKEQLVIRGGSWRTSKPPLRDNLRLVFFDLDVGFRCAKTIKHIAKKIRV